MNIRKMKSSSAETTKRIAKAAREYHSALGSKRTTRLKISGVGKIRFFAAYQYCKGSW